MDTILPAKESDIHHLNSGLRLTYGTDNNAQAEAARWVGEKKPHTKVHVAVLGAFGVGKRSLVDWQVGKAQLHGGAPYKRCFDPIPEDDYPYAFFADGEPVSLRWFPHGVEFSPRKIRETRLSTDPSEDSEHETYPPALSYDDRSYDDMGFSYFQMSSACVLVYSCDRRDSFEMIEYIWSEFYLEREQRYNDGFPVYKPFWVVANKVDIPEADRKVSIEEGRAFSDRIGANFRAMSGRTGEGREWFYKEIADRVVAWQNLKRPVLPDPDLFDDRRQGSQFHFKIPVIGCAGTGVRSIIDWQIGMVDNGRPRRQTWLDAPCRLPYESVHTNSDGRRAKVEWLSCNMYDVPWLDTTDHQGVKMTGYMLRDCDAFVLVYSCTSRYSFDVIKWVWSRLYMEDPHRKTARYWVIATKTDVPEDKWQVPMLEGEWYSSRIGATFRAMSGTTGDGCAGFGDEVVARVLAERPHIEAHPGSPPPEIAPDIVRRVTPCVEVKVGMFGWGGVGKKSILDWQLNVAFGGPPYEPVFDPTDERYEYDHAPYFRNGESVRVSWIPRTTMAPCRKEQYTDSLEWTYVEPLAERSNPNERDWEFDPDVSRQFMRMCDACVLVYACDSRESFENIKWAWIKLYGGLTKCNDGPRDRPFWVVVNKTDVPKSTWQVSIEEGKHFSEQIGASFRIISGKTGEGRTGETGEELYKEIANRVLTVSDSSALSNSSDSTTLGKKEASDHASGICGSPSWMTNAFKRIFRQRKGKH